MCSLIRIKLNNEYFFFHFSGRQQQQQQAQPDTAALLASALNENNDADEDLRLAVQNGQSLQNTDALQSLLATASQVKQCKI
jgi:hypothetical protein